VQALLNILGSRGARRACRIVGLALTTWLIISAIIPGGLLPRIPRFYNPIRFIVGAQARFWCEDAATSRWMYSQCSWYNPQQFSSINNTLALSTIGLYNNMAACYAAIPATGGTCTVPPGWSETWSANLTMNKSLAGFLFMGTAAISMGANQLIVSAGTHGAFLKGTVPFGGLQNAGANGATFTYTGSSQAFKVGNSAGATDRVFGMENIQVFLNSANAATGVYLQNVTYFNLTNVGIIGSSAVNSTGLVCDGAGNFCGTGVLVNPLITFVQTGILGTGSGSNTMNTVTITGGTIQSSGGAPLPNSIGINCDQCLNDRVLGLDIESEATAVRYGANAQFENFEFRTEANTQDVLAIAGSIGNITRVRAFGPSQTLNVSDSGNHNVTVQEGIELSNTFTSSTISASISNQTVFVPQGTIPRNYRLTATAYQVGAGVSCTTNTTLALQVSYSANGIGGVAELVPGWSTQAATLATPGVLAVNNGASGNLIEYLPLVIANSTAATAIQFNATYVAGAGCSPNPTYYIVVTVSPVK